MQAYIIHLNAIVETSRNNTCLVMTYGVRYFQKMGVVSCDSHSKIPIQQN